MPKYKSQNRAANEYRRRNYDQYNIQLPKGMKDELKKMASEDGVSLNRYILDAVEKKSGLKLTLDNTLPWVE